MKKQSFLIRAFLFLLFLPEKLKSEKYKYPLTLSSYIISAFFTGIFCVYFMELFSFLDEHNATFKNLGYFAFIISPVLFIISANIPKWFSPYAGGSGIPQVIYAIKYPSDEISSKMISFKTLVVKIVSILIGIFAGASIGREGPTVQIGACLFWFFIQIFSKIFPIYSDRTTAIISGSAAGLSAAFNTPIAGIAFAIEELSGEHFNKIRDYSIMAIIVASLSAQAITGDYVYFGKLNFTNKLAFDDIILVSIISSIFGVLFVKLFLKTINFVLKLNNKKRYILFPLISSLIIVLFALLIDQNISGAGNLKAKELLNNEVMGNQIIFAISKLISTVLSFSSNVAGGIFAPSLSVGSAVGGGVANFFGLDVSTLSAIAMSAYLSAVIQAPITSFIIVFEMTGHNQLLIPLMTSSLMSYIISKSLGIKPLYHILAERYKTK